MHDFRPKKTRKQRAFFKRRGLVEEIDGGFLATVTLRSKIVAQQFFKIEDGAGRLGKREQCFQRARAYVERHGGGPRTSFDKNFRPKNKYKRKPR